MSNIINITLHVALFITLYFEVFLLITFFEFKIKRSRIEKKNSNKNTNFPTVTIIVPCFNEEKTISKTLFSLLSLDYPEEKLQIMVVDDGSTDDTQKVLKTFSSHKGIKIYSKENGGKHTALNYALEKVDSELVGCLDADSFVDSKALKEIASYFENPDTMAVTPAIKVHEPKSIVQFIQKAEYSLAIFIRRTFADSNSLFITPGPFSIFRRKVFKMIGNYKSAYNTEDLEIALRMHSNQLKIENAHTAHVYTIAPKSIKTLYKQRLRWTFGFLKNIADYKSLMFKKKNGALGMLILPVSIIAIFTALYFTFLFLLSTANGIAQKIIEFQTIGLSTLYLNVDPFYVTTNSVLFLIYALFILTLILIIIGKLLSDEKKIFSIDILFYMFFYGFLAPLWLAGALYNAMFSKKVSWR